MWAWPSGNGWRSDGGIALAVLSDRALVLHWFRLTWHGQRGRMLGLIVGSATVGLLQATFGYLWKVVMDSAATGDAAAAGRTMMAVGLAQSALYIFVQGTRTWMNSHIQRVARDHVYNAVLVGHVEGYRTGDLVTRLTDDLSDEKLAWFLCSGVFRAMEAVMVVGACTAAMLWISPSLTLWSLLPLPALVILHRNIGGLATTTQEAVQVAISKLGTLIHDSFTGVRVIQSSRLEKLAERGFGELANAQAEAEIRNSSVQQLMFAEFVYGWQIAIAVLLVVGGAGIRVGTVTVADFAALAGFLMTMVFQMFDFGAFVVRGRQATTSLRRLQELVDLPAVSRPAASDELRLPAQVVRPFLTLDLGAERVIPPGSLVALTGAVGSGKSTLIQAIAGRTAGAPEAQKTAPNILAPDAAWVPQEPAMFSVTIEENIRLGAEAGPTAAVVARACLDGDIARMPLGLATPVGERGVTLSGGQQQRVQIARALYAARPLLLLDDATSALDADTEARFWGGLAGADRPTVLASTHRPATLARADVVIWLRREGVRSRATVGTHTELLRDSAYSALYGVPFA